MSVDFYLNPVSNDIDLTDNTMRLTANIQESTRQRVLITLSTFKGEWFANINFGIPYLENSTNPEQLLGTADITAFDIAIKEAIVGVETIEELTSYSSSLDRETRQLTVNFSAITESGEVVTVNDLTI